MHGVVGRGLHCGVHCSGRHVLLLISLDGDCISIGEQLGDGRARWQREAGGVAYDAHGDAREAKCVGPLRSERDPQRGNIAAAFDDAAHAAAVVRAGAGVPAAAAPARHAQAQHAGTGAHCAPPRPATAAQARCGVGCVRQPTCTPTPLAHTRA